MNAEEAIQNGKRVLLENGVVESYLERGCSDTPIPSLPGLGSSGSSVSFLRNRQALSKYSVKTQLIGKNYNPDTAVNLFGQSLTLPIFAAPMSGISANLSGTIGEKKFLSSILSGCEKYGTLGMCGDSSETTKDYFIPDLAKSYKAIAVCKPRTQEEILFRINMLKKSRVVAVGLDLDGLGGVVLYGQGALSRKTKSDLEELRRAFDGPMFLKGILSLEDAKIAYETGYDAIVVSNHGGRSVDYASAVADSLVAIAKEYKGKVKIIADGGIRNGYDAFIYLALGADAVMSGRTMLYGAVGGGKEGVAEVLAKFNQELRKMMLFTGFEKVSDIDDSCLIKNE